MRWRHMILLVVFGLGTVHALALTDEEIFRDFRFNLINPGARSLALGGAFISLADDATAAQANPSGLSYLLKPEYFVELRAVDSESEAAGIRDSLPGGGNTVVVTGTNPEDVQNITFASAVFPIKRITLAFSRQVVLNTESSTLNSFAFNFGGGGPGAPTTTQGSGSIDVDQVNLNASLGFRVSDRLAFGASISYARLEVKSDVQNIIFDPGGNLSGTPIIEPTLNLRTRIDDSDGAVGFSLGGIFRPSQSFSFGAVYRWAPKFTVNEEIIDGIDIFDAIGTLGSEFPNEFNLPDSYGIGVSWRPFQRLMFALDIERIEYSDLVDGYVPGVNVLTGFDAEFTADDATDYRLGGEYVLFVKQTVPLAIRAGVFTESDNTVRALNTGTTNSFATADSFPGRDREVHGTVGLGIGLGRQKIDLAFDFADSKNEFLVSYIFTGK